MFNYFTRKCICIYVLYMQISFYFNYLFIHSIPTVQVYFKLPNDEQEKKIGKKRKLKKSHSEVNSKLLLTPRSEVAIPEVSTFENTFTFIGYLLDRVVFLKQYCHVLMLAAPFPV